MVATMQLRPTTLIFFESLGKQCTHVETDAIRYVYVPIEQLFLVLITTKNSNIIEDLEVLQQLNQVVVACCSSSN